MPFPPIRSFTTMRGRWNDSAPGSSLPHGTARARCSPAFTCLLRSEHGLLECPAVDRPFAKSPCQNGNHSGWGIMPQRGRRIMFPACEWRFLRCFLVADACPRPHRAQESTSSRPAFSAITLCKRSKPCGNTVGNPSIVPISRKRSQFLNEGRSRRTRSGR